MVDSRRPCRRTAGASSSRSRNVRPASIEGWISDEEKRADPSWHPGLQSSHCLSIPDSQQINRRQLLVGGCKVEERMIHYLIVWLLCPRASNHSQCSEQDLLFLYGILNHIHIDLSVLISDTMLKAKKYNSYHLPYALLMFRILEYKGVSVEGELTQAIQAIGTEIGETTFRQMRFFARGRVIIHKDDDHQDDDNDDMDAHMADPVQAAAPTDVGPS
ncbi:hypothetical protein LR48_Vigan11g071100 [Vigna angularis]|uniref:Uncharacterized protein n=1 Tax=Phaseolus angularis TaxID=3914 RepID=A0A0L9VRU9_PHAAN|nr:hypothetical protein LR48_Vigan11g071100 [Vigna angularis]